MRRVPKEENLNESIFHLAFDLTQFFENDPHSRGAKVLAIALASRISWKHCTIFDEKHTLELVCITESDISSEIYKMQKFLDEICPEGKQVNTVKISFVSFKEMREAYEGTSLINDCLGDMVFMEMPENLKFNHPKEDAWITTHLNKTKKKIADMDLIFSRDIEKYYEMRINFEKGVKEYGSIPRSAVMGLSLSKEQKHDHYKKHGEFPEQPKEITISSRDDKHRSDIGYSFFKGVMDTSPEHWCLRPQCLLPILNIVLFYEAVMNVEHLTFENLNDEIFKLIFNEKTVDNIFFLSENFFIQHNQILDTALGVYNYSKEEDPQ